MSNIRDRAKQFYNQLDFDKPIGFGKVELFKGSLSEEYYVRSIHGLGDRDPVQELADQIDFADSAGAYLFTGNRGTGKTTELLRLGRLLQTCGCEVFYADMTDYLNMSQSIEVSDFLISLMGAFSEKVAERLGDDPGKPDFFERVWNFLQTEVQFTEIKLPAGPLEFKVALHENPTFRQALQKGVRGYVEQLVKQAREFALETVNRIRSTRGDENLKVIFIVDSVERLRGVGNAEDVRAVFDSAETLFSAHADKLRFTGLSIVYTVPPYLQALAGALGAHFAGGRIYALPSVHIYQGKPKDGEPAKSYKEGLDKLISIIDKRYPPWGDFFTVEQLSRLAENSGGDLRDFFRMLRLAVTRAHRVDTLPYADVVISDAEDAVRGDMLPIAKDDARWLARVAHSHKAELDSLGNLTDFARLQQGKYLLHYCNGQDWYDVHPLLRKEVQASGD